jgi:hypothetical protein
LLSASFLFPLLKRNSFVNAVSRFTFVGRGLAVATLLLVAVGCGGPPQSDYSKVDLLSVDGTVTLDGSPLANAVITFENPEDSTFAYALTDSSGGYELRFDSVMMGCTPGTKLVRISTTRRIPGLNGGEGDGEEGGGEGEGDLGEGEMGEEGGEVQVSTSGGEQVPSQYNRESELEVEVSSGNQHFDFDLVSG